MDPSWSSLQERCLHSIAEFLWQSCLDSAKDDLLDVHLCKRKVLKSIPFLADELRVRIFAHMLGRDQINPEIVKALTLTDADTDASSRGWLQRLDMGSKAGNRMRHQKAGMDRCIISNQGLAMVGAVESLVYLSLANCSGFTDAGLANLNNLKQLKHLDLEGCKSITNDGLLSLRDLDLVYLNLNDVNVSDQGCKTAAEMTSLTTLCLNRTRITHGLYTIIAAALCAGEGDIGTDNNRSRDDQGDHPSKRVGLVSLQHLFLCGNDILAKDLEKLAQLQCIETLDFTGCTNISPKSVADLKRALIARSSTASCDVVAGKKLLVRYHSTLARPQTPTKSAVACDPFALTSSPIGIASPFSFGLSPVAARAKKQKSANPAHLNNVNAPTTSAAATNAFEGELWSCDQFITFLRKGSVVSSNHELLAQQRKNVNRRWSSHRQSVSGIHLSFREDSMTESGSPLSSSHVTVIASPSPQPWAKRKLYDRLANRSLLNESCSSSNNDSLKENALQPTAPTLTPSLSAATTLTPSPVSLCSPITPIRTPKAKGKPAASAFDPFAFDSPSLHLIASSPCSPSPFSPIALLPSVSPLPSRLRPAAPPLSGESPSPCTPAAARSLRRVADFASPSPIAAAAAGPASSRLQPRKSLFASTPSPVKPKASPRTPLQSLSPSPLRPPAFPAFSLSTWTTTTCEAADGEFDLFHDPLLPPSPLASPAKPEVVITPPPPAPPVVARGEKKRKSPDEAGEPATRRKAGRWSQDEAEEEEREGDDDDDDEAEDEEGQRSELLRYHHSTLKAMLKRMGKRNARGTKPALVDMVIRARKALAAIEKKKQKKKSEALASTERQESEEEDESQSDSEEEAEGPTVSPPRPASSGPQLRELDGYIIIDDDDERVSRGLVSGPSTPLPTLGQRTLSFREVDGDDGDDGQEEPLLIPHISPSSNGSSPRACDFGSPLSVSFGGSGSVKLSPHVGALTPALQRSRSSSPRTPSPPPSSRRQIDMSTPRSPANLSPTTSHSPFSPETSSSSSSSSSSASPIASTLSSSTSTYSSPSGFAAGSLHTPSPRSSSSSSSQYSASSSSFSSSSASSSSSSSAALLLPPSSPYTARTSRSSPRSPHVETGQRSSIRRSRLLRRRLELQLLCSPTVTSSSSTPPPPPLSTSFSSSPSPSSTVRRPPPPLLLRPLLAASPSRSLRVPTNDLPAGSESALMEDLDVSATVATRRDAHVKGCSSNDIMRNGDDDGGDDDDVERQMVFGYFSSPSLLRCKSACDESAVESPSTSLLGGSPTTLTTPAPATTAGASATWSASKRRKRRTSLLWEDIISVHEETATATCLYNDTNHVHRKMKRGKMQALHAKEE